MNAIGMGTGTQKNTGPVDLEGRPLKDSDRQALVLDAVVSEVCIDSALDYKKIAMLGGKPSSVLTSIIPVSATTGERTKLKVDAFIQSDSDEQLLLFLPFIRPVKLVSFLVRLSVKTPECNPKEVHLFVNRPSMDFSDADSITPTFVSQFPKDAGRPFTKEELKEGVFEFVCTLPPVKFTDVSFLTMFIVDNHGAPQSKLSGLTLVGRDK